MKEKIKEIAQLRAKAAEAEKEMLKAQKALEQSELGIAYNEAFEKRKAAKQAQEAAEALYKKYCVDNFTLLDAKAREDTQYPGGKIKKFETINYDEQKAINWLLLHKFSAGLQINKGEFKKIAKSIKPEVVSFGTEYRFYLDSDLGEFVDAD